MGGSGRATRDLGAVGWASGARRHEDGSPAGQDDAIAEAWFTTAGSEGACPNKPKHHGGFYGSRRRRHRVLLYPDTVAATEEFLQSVAEISASGTHPNLKGVSADIEYELTNSIDFVENPRASADWFPTLH